MENTIIKLYRGSPYQAALDYQRDAVSMEFIGFSPVCHMWIDGERSVMEFILALLLCFIVIGILFLILYSMKPPGYLMVTYRRDTKPANDLAKVLSAKLARSPTPPQLPPPPTQEELAAIELAKQEAANQDRKIREKEREQAQLAAKRMREQEILKFEERRKAREIEEKASEIPLPVKPAQPMSAAEIEAEDLRRFRESGKK